MANLRIGNSKLKGEIKVPPSKSMAHRAIICAALGNGVSRINNIDYSDDMIATIKGMKALGAKINKHKDYLEVIGIYSNGIKIDSFRTIDCNESGSTLRFLVPISLLFNGMSKFVGKGNLGKRPLTTYFEIFREQGIKYFGREGELDLLIEGKLKPGEFEVLGNVSSQFITGLLFTLPLLNGDSKIIITTEMESKGYIDLTISCMKDFGVEIINKNYKEFIIKGNQNYKSRNYKVEGDYSQAAFYLSADALGSEVLVNDLDLNSLQGDKEVVDILERMNVIFKSKKNALIGEVKNELKSTIIDGSQCPDIIPILAAVASLSKGTTEIINAGRLRIKECDRLKAVASELSKLGADIKEREDGLIIEGKEELQGGVEVWSFKDHRIAMTLAIAATRCKEPIIIKDFECVAKSYPKFFEDFKMLGGDVHEWNMGK
ncbi:3-phosphoshikimate 1-carboxyvinyltransferase [Clostridium chauvoei]|uniref:3-phosphoshikimate 1-carboxyvinyltransferase n=2 Tax=Clostridium chauvoei TaxID=46867 RepID=S6F7S3_9CLOT|nr:3-phosphoshikimate 1-carboxyvinyltransferase [Clostridium chauvoei]ATD54446.1 3-phosphoshikimate 1-carboxyvinyltransferase [Clostridium chauvoei]MBX7279658.1 3-phosphoshikimate 1-carboxyvinyltransferase [Clostridium chauvoei]MBX7282027.1 3-phosphoshikimate 1-carboxyvinyltransferase [Clostridium chauvoei]MBX7284549.1 3-phosphoshikimate 1-carboxyvinyltransferase [Clostridium chauvoei]MBX7287843.1 3-phosphoshikimate 1-carboxyvinyltransferase [Clostridium chauvoei]